MPTFAQKKLHCFGRLSQCCQVQCRLSSSILCFYIGSCFQKMLYTLNITFNKDYLMIVNLLSLNLGIVLPSCDAKCKADIFICPIRISMPAPYLSNSLTQWEYPILAAVCNGVSLNRTTLLGSAPLFRRRSTFLTALTLTAARRAETPSSWTPWLTSAPLDSSKGRHSEFSIAAAQKRGVARREISKTFSGT